VLGVRQYQWCWNYLCIVSFLSKMSPLRCPSLFPLCFLPSSLLTLHLPYPFLSVSHFQCRVQLWGHAVHVIPGRQGIPGMTFTSTPARRWMNFGEVWAKIKASSEWSHQCAVLHSLSLVERQSVRSGVECRTGFAGDQSKERQSSVKSVVLV